MKRTGITDKSRGSIQGFLVNAALKTLLRIRSQASLFPVHIGTGLFGTQEGSTSGPLRCGPDVDRWWTSTDKNLLQTYTVTGSCHESSMSFW